MAHTMTHPISREMQACLDNCTECHQVCLETIQHCLEKGGAHADPEHIKLLSDCVAICQTSANFLTRQSGRHGSICAVCAQICDACAEDCEKFGEDEMMKQCAEVCRRCAQSCRQMASA